MKGEEEYIINLDLPAEERWSFLVGFQEEVNELLECYLNDFEGAKYLFDSIGEFKNEVISQDYLKEIEFIASISNYSANEVLIANLYYDVLKFYFGCTAFAVETNGKILHARNLDWWTDNNILSTHSRIFDFQKNNKTIFKTVGWFGFIGALSGIKPEHFSITLNAVLSKDSPEIATPVSFLLRDVLEQADSYETAKGKLEQTVIASDCLLLIAGACKNKMAVIERTPKRHATRLPNQNFITVTNDYKLIENNVAGESELQSTSCGRFEQAEELISQNNPSSNNECLKILSDENVMMGITVQQMVFDITTGGIELIKTGSNTV
ncbi:MAG: C45 family autoproteolytic acyltransferase/hydrolase [Cyclobacteriaceae bacterium]